MYLIDANVFLEALLEQDETLSVQSFLSSTNVEQMFITDLALHSIGITLFRLNKADLFITFVESIIIDRIGVLSLGNDELENVKRISQVFKLDFDDSYQYAIAEKYDFQIISFDKHFDRTARKRKKPSDMFGLGNS